MLKLSIGVGYADLDVCCRARAVSSRWRGILPPAPTPRRFGSGIGELLKLPDRGFDGLRNPLEGGDALHGTVHGIAEQLGLRSIDLARRGKGKAARAAPGNVCRCRKRVRSNSFSMSGE